MKEHTFFNSRFKGLPLTSVRVPFGGTLVLAAGLPGITATMVALSRTRPNKI